MSTERFYIAVIGAGPAGLFAARMLAGRGAEVALFNRDVKPGGLAEYGIYYDKYKMKAGLRRQFGNILEESGISYYGNVTIGNTGDLSLNDLLEMGFHAVLVTAGAQGTKWLGLPGEDLVGVYHAKDLVYHYNRLPPYSTRDYHIGQRIAIIGVGNVMMDIAHWAIHDLKVGEVIGIARRGPAEVKFTKKEMGYIGAYLDREALEDEINRVAPVMRSIGQNVEAAHRYILEGTLKAEPAVSNSRLRFEFLTSPLKILGDSQGMVCGLEVEDTTLTGEPENPKAKSLETTRVLEVDTVVFCIGDKVDEGFGLPVKWNAFVKNPEPHYPAAGLSYEAFDPETEQPIEGVFVAGWSREASSGLVGVARKDGENGAQAVLQFLSHRDNLADWEVVRRKLEERMRGFRKPVISQSDIKLLDAAEQAEAERRGLAEFKFSTNAEMYEVLESQAA